MTGREKRTPHVPKDMVEQVQRRVAAGREVLTANAWLLVLARKQRRKTGP